MDFKQVRPPQAGKRFLGITIKPGHNIINLLAMMILPFITNSLNLDILSTTVQLMSDPNYFNIQKTELSTLSSELNFYCVPAQMAIVLIAGYGYDIFGRRVTIFTCLVVASVAAFFMPYTSPTVYPWLFLCKLLCTMAIQPCFSQPLVNDYVTGDTRGGGVALCLMGVELGHLFSSKILFYYTNKLDNPKLSFMIAAIYGGAAAVLLMFMISEPKSLPNLA